MIKDILNSLPVLLISIAATVTGGTAVSKIAQEVRPSFMNDAREVQEARAVAPTPSPLDDSNGGTETPTPSVDATMIPTQETAPATVATTTKAKITTASAGTFTLATLAQHNKNGNCYVAYKGVVYNVSAHPSWQNCVHHGTRGGRDITSIFPHPTSYFSTLPKVGTLTKTTSTSGSSSGSTGTSNSNSGSTSNDSDSDSDDDSETEHEQEQENEIELEFEKD